MMGNGKAAIGLKRMSPMAPKDGDFATSCYTYERERVRWNLWRSPRNMIKDLGGKERVETSQYGFSKPPGGH